MKIAYVCTSYNNSAFTVTAVETLLKNQGHDIRIYVVDNASREEEVDILHQLSRNHPSVRLIASPVNVGYFAGLNLGIKAARAEDGACEWMIVGNNDLEFPESFCITVEQRASEYTAHSVISPDVVTLDGHHQNPHVIAGISPIREVFYDLYYSNYHLGLLIYKLAKIFPNATRRGDEDHWKTARLIHQGHGSVYLLTPKFFSQFEELWSPSFMMSEEFFLAVQLKRVGEQVFYSPVIRVVHHWHGSLQDVPSRRRWSMARDAHRESRKYASVFKGDVAN
jgi:GT2 family glycosyltransferase